MPVDVALADLHEAAGRPQHLEALGDRLARQRVEHDIHALAPGGGQHLVGEREGPGIEDVLDAKRVQMFTFLGGTCGRVHGRAEPASDLHRRQAHAACAGVDEDVLPTAQPRLFIQAVVGGQVGDGQGGRRLETQLAQAWRPPGRQG